MKLTRCDNCGGEDDSIEPFDGCLVTMKGDVEQKGSHYAFQLHLCGDCVQKIFDAFPKMRESTELY